ncbi:MAG: hypothetical protein D6805_02205 [Planctomycetota bacterium]|nr:MAG: hypothetical protein D6805_02205 [Planctomycetota bacterium]
MKKKMIFALVWGGACFFSFSLWARDSSPTYRVEPPAAGASETKTSKVDFPPPRKGQVDFWEPFGIAVEWSFLTGSRFIDPSWYADFGGIRLNSDFEGVEIWEFRVGGRAKAKGFLLNFEFLGGVVMDGELDLQRHTTTSVVAYSGGLDGFDLGLRADFMRRLGGSRIFWKIVGLVYSYQNFSMKEATTSYAPTTGLQGVDSWFRLQYLQLRMGFHFVPPWESGVALIWGIDFIPVAWIFAKEVERTDEPTRVENARTEVLGKGGVGVEGYAGIRFSLSRFERVTFGIEWRYFSLESGYIRRNGASYQRLSLDEAEVAEVLLFIQYSLRF